LEAIAIPTEVAMPWPSGPVVVSTPEVQRYSGWPGAFESSWRKLSMSLIDDLVVGVDRLDAGQVEHRVEQHRGVAGGEDEAIAAGPDRIFGVEAQVTLPERIGDRGHRHRGPRVAGVGLLDRVDRQRADRVDAKLVEILRHGQRS
jgi:hypothetical protein